MRAGPEAHPWRAHTTLRCGKEGLGARESAQEAVYELLGVERRQIICALT